jgi:hypothetical protein
MRCSRSPEPHLRHALQRFAEVRRDTRALEQELQMQTGNYNFKSPYARVFFAKGYTVGEAEALLLVLGARGMVVDETTRELIRSCNDSEQLERWIVRAVTASSLHEVLWKP